MSGIQKSAVSEENLEPTCISNLFCCSGYVIPPKEWLELLLCTFQWMLYHSMLTIQLSYIITGVQSWEGGGGVTPILGHSREIFDPNKSLFYASSWSEEISLSLSYLVPEIIGPKFGLIFTKNVLFKFLSILYQFSPWFSIQLTPFSLILDILDHSFFYKTLYPIGANLLSHAEPDYRKFSKVPLQGVQYSETCLSRPLNSATNHHLQPNLMALFLHHNNFKDVITVP